jgi:hypothetical protein
MLRFALSEAPFPGYLVVVNVNLKREMLKVLKLTESIHRCRE